MIPTLPLQQTRLAAHDEYISRTTIHYVYGLPPSWIRQLGRPDRLKAHPRHANKTISCYSRQRVEALIDARQPAYLRMLVARARKSRPQRAAISRQAQDLITWARTVEIVSASLPDTLAQLRQEVEAAFLARPDRPNGQRVVLTEKAIVAHLRHSCTNYHRLLAQLKRGPGTTVAYLILKRRVNQAVRERLQQQYGDALAEACQ